MISLSLPSLTRLDHDVRLLSQGETLYFPTGWVHATSNIGEGVAIGMQATYNFKERKATGEKAGGLFKEGLEFGQAILSGNVTEAIKEGCEFFE